MLVVCTSASNHLHDHLAAAVSSYASALVYTSDFRARCCRSIILRLIVFIRRLPLAFRRVNATCRLHRHRLLPLLRVCAVLLLAL